MKNIKKVSLSAVLGILLALPVQAQIPQGNAVTLTTIQRIIEEIATFLIETALIVAVIYIIWSGIRYMMAGDDASKATEAKGQLKSAVIGALIVLAVGVILATIKQIVTYQTLGF